MSLSKRAAYFELRADYFGRGFDSGILGALKQAGFDVDIYAEGSDPSANPSASRPGIRRVDVQYRRRWLASHMSPRAWRQYDLFLGTADIPMAFAALLAALARRPVVTACDEIFVGGYVGHASGSWKAVTRWGMRRSAFTIISDAVRIPLQRKYAGLGARHSFVELPCCFLTPPQPEREATRSSHSLAASDVVVSLTGALTEEDGTDWAIRLLDRHGDVKLLVQPGGSSGAVLDALFHRLQAEGRAVYLPERVSYARAAALSSAADVGLVLYRSTKPQFQRMGVSSQKLCTYLQLGIPVIATRQPSFQFIEEFGCGVLIDEEHQLPAALERVLSERCAMSENALRAAREYIRPAERMQRLAERFAEMP